jgi:polyhydroxyalkanoic acid synthase PhaR subunit
MAEQANLDPLAMWREWVANSERQWNGFMNNAMATDEFSQTMGRMMDVYLNMQKNMNEVMGRYLQLINVPTRNDILGLGERLSQIEDRLGQIENAIGAVQRSTAAQAPAAPDAPSRPRPARTKKPVKA